MPPHIDPGTASLFDAEADLNVMRRRAAALGTIMAATAVSAAGATEWRVSDPSRKAFGALIPSEALPDEQLFVSRVLSA